MQCLKIRSCVSQCLYYALILVCLTSPGLPIMAQNNPINSSTQISGTVGLSAYALTDEHISNSRYSGSLNTLNLILEQNRPSKIFQLGIEIQSASGLTDSDIQGLSARVDRFALHVNHLFHHKNIRVFNKESMLYLGMGYGVNVYVREQNVALGGRLEDELTSLFLALPLRFNVRVDVPLSSHTILTSALGLNLLAVGIRSDLQDELVANISSGVGQFRGKVDLRLSHRLSPSISAIVHFHYSVLRYTPLPQNLYSGISGFRAGLLFDLKKKER